MQDVQNIPNPDVDSIVRDGDFGNHSDTDQNQIDSDVNQTSEDIPTPPDREPSYPIEEPPAADNMEEPRRIV